MSNLRDRIMLGVAVLGLSGGLIAVYADIRSEQARLSERMDAVVQTNERTLSVLERLAESVDRLSVSVARLDERTRALEGR